MAKAVNYSSDTIYSSAGNIMATSDWIIRRIDAFILDKYDADTDQRLRDATSLISWIRSELTDAD